MCKKLYLCYFKKSATSSFKLYFIVLAWICLHLITSVFFSAQSYKLFTPVSIKSNLDIEHFGEKALLEYKDQRELRERLHQVDEQLNNLHNRDEDEVRI